MKVNAESVQIKARVLDTPVLQYGGAGTQALQVCRIRLEVFEVDLIKALTLETTKWCLEYVSSPFNSYRLNTTNP